MALTPDDIVDAYWEALDDLPQGALPAASSLHLLAALCDRLNQIEPSQRFREEAEESRETAQLHGRMQSGSDVPLAYVYSAVGDGYVELSTFNAEAAEEEGESGTVVGTPGVTVRFDAAEARRAVQILSAAFPSA